MMVKRRDFQKVAAQIHEFLLKLSDEVECAELRDALNLTLLQMQRYYRLIRNRSQFNDQTTIGASNGANGILSRSLRGMSPLTPFRDAPDKFVWRWVDLESIRAGGATLPARLEKEETTIPSVIRATRQGDSNLLLQLIERDPDSVSAQDALGRSAIVYAVQFSCLDTLQLLLEQGAGVNSVSNDGSTAVHYACHNGNHEALQILIQYAADLTVQDMRGRAPIHWACITTSKECLQTLIDAGVDVGVRDDDGLSPSMWACRLDHIEHFALLSTVQTQQQQQRGRNRPDDDDEEDGFERDKARRTWMHWSIRRTEPLECLKTLLTEESARLADEDGKSVLHVAAEQGSLPSVKVILEIAGKQCLEQRDNCNRTPLILATMGGHGEVVNCLLSEGADLACVDNLGATAWDYAGAKQLHYCMLIIASYIRQRAREQESASSSQNLNTMLSEGIGIEQLQINSDGNTALSYLHTNGPHPPSTTRPPVTPRTPRTPRRNGFLVRQSSDEATPRQPVPANRSSSSPSRSGGPPQKRSPSTPMEEEEDEEAEEERKNDRDVSSGSKRMRSEIKLVERAGSANNPIKRHSPSRSSSVFINSENNRQNSSHNGNGESGGDDEASVSIDVMDVSDFESENRRDQDTYLDVIELDQGMPPSPRPPGTPRTRDNGSPERRPAARRLHSSGGAKDKAGQPSTGYAAQQNLNRQPKESYDGDYEDEDRLGPDRRKHQGNHAGNRQEPGGMSVRPARNPSPDGVSSEQQVDSKTSAPTPHHLLPLQPNASSAAKKKKKKKMYSHNVNIPQPQSQSYVAPTQAPYPVSHHPPPSPRSDRQSSTSKVKSTNEPAYPGAGYNSYMESESQDGLGKGGTSAGDGDRDDSHVDSWQRSRDPYDYDDDERSSEDRSGLPKKGRRGSGSAATTRGQKYPGQNVLPSGELNRIPYSQQQTGEKRKNLECDYTAAKRSSTHLKQLSDDAVQETKAENKFLPEGSIIMDDCPVQKNMDFHLNLRSPVPDGKVHCSSDEEAEDAYADDDAEDADEDAEDVDPHEDTKNADPREDADVDEDADADEDAEDVDPHEDTKDADPREDADVDEDTKDADPREDADVDEDADADEDAEDYLNFWNRRKMRTLRTIDSEDDDIQVSVKSEGIKSSRRSLFGNKHARKSDLRVGDSQIKEDVQVSVETKGIKSSRSSPYGNKRVRKSDLHVSDSQNKEDIQVSVEARGIKSSRSSLYGNKHARKSDLRVGDSQNKEVIQVSVETRGIESNQGSMSTSNNGDASEPWALLVGQSQKSANDTRKYDKQVACPFCSKLLRGKLRRHLERVHDDEPEVAQLVSLTSREQCRMGFALLVNRGNFKHNASVLSAKEGSLIVRRRPSKKARNSCDYLPCQYCLAMFLRRDLWRHVGKCPFKTFEKDPLSDDTKRRSSVTAASRMVLEGATNSESVTVSQQFREDILDRMRYDKLTRRARNDILVMRYGSNMHHRHGRERVYNISQHMRLLARLLLEVRFEEDEANQHVTLDQCLAGGRFDAVVEATERLCKREIDKDSGRPLFKSPTFGLHIGHILVKCADMKKGMAIRTEDKVMEAEADSFLALHRSDWTNRISSASLASLKHRSYNNPDILPLTSDLVKLKQYQEQSLTVFTEMLKKKPTYSVWRQLSDIVYSRVVIFNKRRGGETAKLHLSAFLKRPKWKGVANDVLRQSLKPLEQKLLNRMDMVHLPGKGMGGRRVPLILSPNIVTAMDLLVEKRECCLIPAGNVYFFATSSINGYINGWQVMQDVAAAAKLEHPKLVHSTRLRKYVATVSQVVSLSPGEMKWLANHLGHNVNIFEDVYRLQDSTIELAKISRLLMAVDTGQVSQFAGKSLDDIQISDIPPDVDDTDDDVVDDDDDDDVAADDGIVTHKNAKAATMTPTKGVSSTVTKAGMKKLKTSLHSLQSQPSTSSKQSAGMSSTATNVGMSELKPSLHSLQSQASTSSKPSAVISDDDSTFSSLPEEPEKPPLKKRKAGVRVKWTAEELSIVRKELVDFFTSRTVPTNAEINRIIQTYPAFKKRTVPQIKSRAWALIQKRK